MSRRTLFSLLVPIALLLGYVAVRSGVRAHVDGLISASIGKPLPAFALVDDQGEEWTAERLRGKRAVLHFFRSRCGSCDVEAPEIRALEQALPDDVQMLHVVTDGLLGFAAAETAATIAGKRFARPTLLANAAFADAFHKAQWSQVTPITYVVDAAGVVRYGLRGGQSKAAIEQALAAAR
jgi:thiol-disulfide isomerase/thioredoxin